MKRMLALVMLSVALSIAGTLFATWISFTLRARLHEEPIELVEVIPA
jgi:hypothetical protein